MRVLGFFVLIPSAWVGQSRDRVGDGHNQWPSDFQRIAEGVYLQGQRLANTRIGRVALVVVADGFPLMLKIDRVVVTS